jgi:hypothetical protein
MECEFSRTHIKKTGQLLGARVPHSLDAAKEVFGGHFQNEVQENSKTPSEVLGRLRDCPRDTPHLGYGMRHGPRPTSIVTTCNVVGLLI